MVENKIIPFPNQDHQRAREDIAYNKTVDRCNLFEKIARWTPKLILASIAGGLIVGWHSKRLFDENIDYRR